MKAAIASREKILLRTSLEKAQETYVYFITIFYLKVNYVVHSAAGSANPDQVFKLEIFQGVFLDIRSVIGQAVKYPRSHIPGRQLSLVSFSESAHFSLLLSVLIINRLCL